MICSIGTGGWVDTPSQHLGIRPVLPFVQANDLEQVPIKRVNGQTVRVGRGRLPGPDTIDIGDGVERIDHRVGPALVDDGLAASRLEGRQIRVRLIDELADERVAQPSDVVKVGDGVRVRVVGIDDERRRLSLSIRQARPA